MKKNRAVFQNNREANKATAQEWEMKFKKQLELSQSDAAVIEQHQKKIFMQKMELDEIKNQYKDLERLFKGMKAQGPTLEGLKGDVE